VKRVRYLSTGTDRIQGLMVCRTAYTTATPVVYTRNKLLHLRSTATSTLDNDVYNRTDSVTAGPVRSTRGSRAGRQRRLLLQYTRCVGSGISISLVIVQRRSLQVTTEQQSTILAI